MRIAIFGTGGVSGYFGGRLAQAGADVVFIARGEHLQAMRQHGLAVDSIKGDFVVHPIQTGAVTYVVQRFASLAALFYIGSLACYVKARLKVETKSEILLAGHIPSGAWNNCGRLCPWS